MTTPARDAALKALKAIRRSGQYAEDAVAAACTELEGRERALAWRLIFGVVQNGTYLDWCVGELTPLGRLEPQALDILRLGAYQLLFLDRIPKPAAVNEAVEQAKKACPRASGLVNAVLRKIADMDIRPEPSRDENYISVKYSLPKWLVGRLRGVLGDDGAEAFAKASGETPPVTLHKNPLKGFDASGIPGLEPHPWLDGAVEYRGELDGLEPLKTGRLLIADAAAELAARALDPKPGERVWDACAAPGGKSLLSAFKMDNEGFILATDISDGKLGLLSRSAELYGASIIKTERGDAREYEPDGQFDAVLCDVPCSGFGVLRKKPDIRYKTEDEIKGLPDIQLSILRNAARFVVPGGRLVYSTCTVLPEENSAVCEAFLRDSPGFVMEGFELPAGDASGGEVTLWPHIHGTDGFYICRMRRA